MGSQEGQVNRAVKPTHVLLATVLVAASLMALSSGESPFACNRLALNSQERERHFGEVSKSLRAAVTRARELPDGFEFAFPPDSATARLLSEWVIDERLCCPFFDIDIRWEREGGPAWLRLTGRSGVKQFIKADFPRWFK